MSHQSGQVPAARDSLRVSTSARRVFLTAAILLTPFAAPIVRAQAVGSRPLSIADYLEWETVGDPQISPDGRRVIYTRRWVNKQTDRWESALWEMTIDGTEQRPIGRGSGVQWSPDGTRIAYLAAGEPRGSQIFVRWMLGSAAGTAIQVTRVDHPPQHVRWSPDGKSLSFTMLVPAAKSWPIDLPDAPAGATWSKPPIMIDRLVFRTDGVGYMPEGHTHLFVVSAGGGTPRQLTSGEWHVGARPYGVLYWDTAPQWTPDGREIVIEGLRAPDWEYRYREVHFYAVNVATGALRTVVDRKGIWSNPVISPDGRWVAFTGYEWTLDAYRAYDLHVVGIDGRNWRKLAANLDRNVENPLWAADSKGLVFSAGNHGSVNVYWAGVDGGVRPVTEGTQVVSLSSLSQTGVAVGTHSTAHAPSDVARFALAGPKEVVRLTHVNDDILEGKQLGEVEELWYSATGGPRVQGWVVKPPRFDAGKKYPLILEIHGGPNEMYDVGFDFGLQHWAAGGYVVLYTNPRGSTGYGTAFGNAIDKAYPSVDYDDLMAGVDAVVARGYVDPERLYVTGCSAGGTLTAWVIGHTNRFAAAAPRCVTANRISAAGTSDVALYRYHHSFRRPFWEDPTDWLKLSPIMYVDKITTPTLLMTGENDLRTPITQAEELYQALKVRRVPTVLLRFQDESHGTGSRPSNFMNTQLYVLSWFDKYRGVRRGDGRAPPP